MIFDIHEISAVEARNRLLKCLEEKRELAASSLDKKKFAVTVQAKAIFKEEYTPAVVIGGMKLALEELGIECETSRDLDTGEITVYIRRQGQI